MGFGVRWLLWECHYCVLSAMFDCVWISLTIDCVKNKNKWILCGNKNNKKVKMNIRKKKELAIYLYYFQMAENDIYMDTHGDLAFRGAF